ALGVLEPRQRAAISRIVANPVEAIEQLPRLYDGPLGERPFLNDAVYPRADLYAPVRHHLARELVRLRHRPRPYLHDRHLRRWECRRCAFAATRGGHEEQDPGPRPNVLPSHCTPPCWI